MGTLFWMVSLPLKHRESCPGDEAKIEEDRSNLYSMIHDHLGVRNDLATVHQFIFPEFKVYYCKRSFLCNNIVV